MFRVKGFHCSVIPVAKPMDVNCMNCPFMPRFAKIGDICVKYRPVNLPVFDFGELERP